MNHARLPFEVRLELGMINVRGLGRREQRAADEARWKWLHKSAHFEMQKVDGVPTMVRVVDDGEAKRVTPRRHQARAIVRQMRRVNARGR